MTPQPAAPMRLNMSMSRTEMTPEMMIPAITAHRTKATTVVMSAFFLS